MACSIFAPLLLLSTFTAGLQEIRVEGEGEGSVVLVSLDRPPTFTTTLEPDRFVVDLLGVEGRHGTIPTQGAKGIRSLATEPWTRGLRLRVELEPWAEAAPRVEGGVFSIHVAPGPVEVARRNDPGPDAAEAIAAALPDEAAAPPRPTAAPAPKVLAQEAPLVVTPHAAPPSPPERPSPVTQPLRQVSVPPILPEESSPPAPPVAAPALGSPAEAPRPISAEASPGRSDLTSLSFQAGPPARIVIGLEGEAKPSLEEKDGMLLLHLPGTRIRRANDRRPFDAAFFGTAVGLIRPLEDRRGTRIEIRLRRPAASNLRREADRIEVELFSR